MADDLRESLTRLLDDYEGRGRIEAGITLGIVPSGTKAPLHEDQR